MVEQWTWMIEVNVAALKLPEVSQLGSWLYQTQLWPIFVSVSRLLKHIQR